MISGVAQAVKTQVMGAEQPPSKWTTRMTQHSDPVETNDLLCGCCCIPFGAAIAKSAADKTHPCFNFFCFTPCASYSWVRYGYNIEGVCGDDLCYGLLCPCFTTRQLYTEARIRGPAVGTNMYGANTNEWSKSLFDCGACELLQMCFCLPCVVHEVRKGLQPKVDSCCYDMLCTNPLSLYGQVRHSYGIVTDFPLVEDMCLPIACFPCAVNRARHQVNDVPIGGTGGSAGAANFLPAPGAYRRF